MVSGDGHVKIADFGIAKALATLAGDEFSRPPGRDRRDARVHGARAGDR